MFGVWRMIMKKYIIILLTICLSLSMVACSMNNNVSDSVDLPHPDGPNSTKNSPFSTDFLKPEHLFRMICLYQLILIFSFCLLYAPHIN